MDEEGVMPGGGEREDEHEGVIQSELPHVVVAVEGTLAAGEVGIGDEQTTAAAIEVLDNELVAAVINTVHDGIAIPRIEITNPFPTTLLHRL